MGLGLNTSVSHGLVGLGYTINEVSIKMNGTEYDNLPIAMVRENVTNTVAFSLWLNDLGKRQNHCVLALDFPNDCSQTQTREMCFSAASTLKSTLAT
jgi:hypothetical protein